MGDTYLSLRLHLVWATKRRQPWLDPAWRPRLFAYTAGVIATEGGRLLCAGGIRDHIHLYVEPPATAGLADLVRVIKTNTSRWIRREIPSCSDFAWQHGYAAFTASSHDDRRLKDYVRSQEVHHREVSFPSEYEAILGQHGLATSAIRAFD